MNHTAYSVTATLWRYDAFGGWHFVTIPRSLSQEIKERFGSTYKRGWGSLPVRATIGQTTWRTSIFPSKGGEYLLAVKSDVRQKEKIGEGDVLTLSLEIHV